MFIFLFALFKDASSTTSKFDALAPTIICFAVIDVPRQALDTSSSKALGCGRRILFSRVLFATSHHNTEPFLIIGSATAPHRILSMSALIPHFSASILFMDMTKRVTLDLRYPAYATKVKLRSTITPRHLYCSTYFIFWLFILIMGSLFSFILLLIVMAIVLGAEIFSLC